jgi:DNA-binding transcriptional ArsR family regulator
MPQQLLVAEQLADILAVIAHPHRIRIIEELGRRESDVHSLAEKLNLRQSTLSQHLAQLRTMGIAAAERDGRTVRYHLTNVWLARWLVDGFKLLEMQSNKSSQIMEAAKAVKKMWHIKKR